MYERVMGAKKKEPTKRPLVLIVDDVEDNRAMYAEYLAYKGMRVVEAVDGREAIELARKLRPKVIVMDLSMPGTDGWEATRLIKANPRMKSIVVLVLTGHATKDDLERARAAGADHICTKPCLPAELLARVEELLSRV